MRARRTFLIAALIAVLVTAWLFLRVKDRTSETRLVDKAVTELLAGFGVGDADLRYSRTEEIRSGRELLLSIERGYSVAQSFDAKAFEQAVREAAARTRFDVTSVVSSVRDGVRGDGLVLSFAGRRLYEIMLMRSKRPSYAAKAGVRKAAAAKVAIVLDDFGYNRNNVDAVFAIGEPVTLSILPGLPYSGAVAGSAGEKGYETILHLPMEPESADPDRLEKGTIFSGMSEKKVLSIIDEALATVPGVKGVSNHMGSRATADERLMRVVLKELKRRDLFFLDSLSTPNTVCGGLARDIGVEYGRRAIFLDNESDPAYIRAQLESLAGQALRTGQAIGVGHDRANTIRAITDYAPDMRAAGVEFVFVSDLVR